MSELSPQIVDKENMKDSLWILKEILCRIYFFRMNHVTMETKIA